MHTQILGYMFAYVTYVTHRQDIQNVIKIF